MKKRSLWAMVLLWALSIPIHAQQSEPTSTEATAETLSLSLADAQKYAVEHNRSLQNASLAVKQAEAARWQAIAAMLPQVDGALVYSNMCGYQIDFGGMSMSMPANGQLNVTASIALNGQMIMSALINNLAIEMQDISRQQSELNLNMNVQQAYMSILAMEDIVNLLDQSLANVETLQSMTQRSVDVGIQEQTAADQIAVRVASIKNSINSNKRNVELYYNSLRVLLGVSADANLQLSQTLDELLNPESLLTLLSNEVDINRNYDYQLLQKNTELAKKQITTTAMAYTPTLSLAYQYTGKTYFNQSAGFDMTPPNAVSINLSVPIWSSGKRASAVTEKKLAYKAAQNTLAETKDNLLVQDRQLRYNLNNAYETYMNERSNLSVTQRVFTSTSNKFTHGVSSSLELTNASNDLISAQSTYVQAVLTLISAQTDFVKFLNK